MSPERRATLRTVGGVVFAALGARLIAQGLLAGVLLAMGMLYFGEEAWSYLGALAGVVGGTLLAALGAFLVEGEGGLARAPRVGLAGGVVVLAGLLVANHQRHLSGVFSWGFTPEPEVGRYPFEAGRTVTEERSGYVGHAHIGADGFRICAPGGAPQDGAVRVGLYGDSMVFGLAIPDEATMCWRLREHFAASAPGRFAWSNRGQPGANAHSYARTLAWAEDRWPSEVAVVGLLVPNDGEIIDVNAHRVVRDAPWFRLLASALDPETVLSAVMVFSKVGRSDLFEWVSFRQGIRALAAASEARGLTTLWFVWDYPQGHHRAGGVLRAYDALVREVADAHPHVRYLGVLSEPEAPPGVVHRIPHDGHQTPAGVEALLPVWSAAIADAAGALP